jgi:phosphoribosylanthranilate isomerase
MTKIKFCGMTRSSDVAVARRLGASHVGVIFADSKRRVTADKAREILDAADGMQRVGVFGHAAESLGQILRIARNADLDVLQLHGNFTHDEIGHLREDFEGHLWAVLPVDTKATILPPEWDLVADLVDALVLDSAVAGRSGGTGKAFDWEAMASSTRHLSSMLPVVVAGGLKPGNVALAIRTLQPAIVDVSSGVESAPGLKDPRMMEAFAEAVASASIV